MEICDIKLDDALLQASQDENAGGDPDVLSKGQHGNFFGIEDEDNSDRDLT